MKAKKLSVLLVLAALGLAALLIVSCVPTQQGDIQKKSPSPSADMTTEKQAAEITKTPNITPEVTAAPRLDCPTAEELNEHDYNAVRAFLEIKDENGVRNGEKLNESYDPDDPATWFYNGEVVADSLYEISAIAVWDEENRLSEFSTGGIDADVVFVGEPDLSNCAALKHVFVYGGIKSINVAGCDNLEVFGCSRSLIESISPGVVTSQRFRVFDCPLRQLHWKAVPGEENINVYDFDLKLTADGAGYVGVTDMNETAYQEIHITAQPEEGHKFVGWYDQNGNLISTEESYEITSFETATHFTGTFDYIARFE